MSTSSRRALLALLVCATPASAEELVVHFEAGVRIGFGFPVGDLSGSTQSTQGSSVGNWVAWTVPIQIDAGARIGPVFVGGFGSYAFGKAGSALENASTRSAGDVRVGFEVLWHFAPEGKVDPWAGLGVGYEWLTLNATVGTLGASVTVRGFEFVNAQAGIDFPLGRTFRIGPCLQLTLAQYSSASGELTTPRATFPGSGDIQAKTLHSWINVGLRFALLL
jgi:hypothetical protein